MLLDRSSIDMVLVPSGLLVMFGYHLFLLYRILRPQTTMTTAIGYENELKEQWVKSMLQIKSAKDRTLPLGVISSNISAATTLSSISIALASLIGAVVGTTTKAPVTDLVYGDISQSTASIKYICLLVCFLAAFTCFIHSTRYYVHSSFLISTMESNVNLNYVRQSVLRGAISGHWGSEHSTSRPPCSCGSSGLSRCSHARCAWCSSSTSWTASPRCQATASSSPQSRENRRSRRRGM